MMTARMWLLLILPVFVSAGCAPVGVNFVRVHCQPIQKLGSLDGVAFGADIDTNGYAGQQLVYQVVLLDRNGRPLRSIDGEYQNAAGAVSASKTLMVLQSPQSFENAEIVIPAKELEVREDDMPVTAAFTLALSDGTPIASAKSRLPLERPTLGVLATDPPTEPETGFEPGEPEPDDAEAALDTDADLETVEDREDDEAPVAPPVDEYPTARPAADEELAIRPTAASAPLRQPVRGAKLSDDEASAIAAIFQKDAISSKKDTEIPPSREVDGVGTRPIMAAVGSGDVGGRAGDLRKSPPAAESQPANPAATIHVVRSGETLSGIAKKYYGDASLWPLIFEANRQELDSPDDIEAGMKLKVPILAENREKSGDKPD